MLALCLTCIREKTDFKAKLKVFYPIAGELLNYAEGFQHPQDFAEWVLRVPMNYPKQFFWFLKPIGLDLHIQSDLYVKLNKSTEFILELSAKMKEISHKPVFVRFSLSLLSKNKEEFKFEREKNVGAAGVCSISFPIVLNITGLFVFKIKASVINLQGREIGKAEYSEINLECI